ncbi:hypothetical protein B0H13DRAFT_2331273 [Mycena leptocephala]|nr:hypothetical protein B0H13DRAFT_2331273 [Mycena leptocephala]
MSSGQHESFHRRLLSRLRVLSLPLLSESSLGRDFVVPTESSNNDVTYEGRGGQPFAAVVVGLVTSVRRENGGWTFLEVGIPDYADAAMRDFFRTQIACLKAVLRIEMRDILSKPYHIVEDTIPWLNEQGTGVQTDGKITIRIDLPPSCLVRRATPFFALSRARSGSDCSTASSSTMSSTDDLTADAANSVIVASGDLVAAVCRLSRRTFRDQTY